MRVCFSFVVAMLLLTAVPAVAGNITFAQGQTGWQSTLCPVPVVPPSLVGLDPETHADDMNRLMSQYNQYAKLMQAYMDCVSHEAQNDAAAASRTIVGTAQGVIDEAQNKVVRLGASLQKP